MKTMSPVAPQSAEWRSPSPGFKLTLATETAQYAVRLANSLADIRAAQALRLNVFNLESAEGLERSCETLLDADEFDGVCEHLVAQELKTGVIVGTYRLQTGRHAARYLGYFWAREFDLTPFESLRGGLVELGRAYVARPDRNCFVLQLLLRGIAFYARTHGARYLIGCSSIRSQDPRDGAAAYSSLMRVHLAPPELQTRPMPGVACPLDQIAEEPPRLPELLAAYLALGARICGPPAIDRKLKTIDFLTLLDLHALPKEAAEKYLR